MDAWQITETVAFITKHKATKIALQYPDHLLKKSSSILELLKTKLCKTQKNTDYKIYIMADTTFAACCVDEISAQHVNADVIIHYGWTCCSPTNRIPVFHVLGKQSFDIQLVHRLFSEPSIFDQTFCAFSKILILYEPHYSHYYETFIHLFKKQHKNIKIIVSQIRNESSLRSKTHCDDDEKVVESKENNFGHSHFCGFYFEDMIDKNEWKQLLESDNFCIDDIKSKHCVLYIGDDEFDEFAEKTSSKNQLFLSLLINFGSCFRFVSYNPKNIESHLQNDDDGNNKDSMKQILDKLGVDKIFNTKQNDALLHKFQMYRYSLIEKIKKSDIIGIVCATLVVDNYLDIIKRLKEKIRKNGKKAYMFSVGKINQAKLGNFSEIDIFVVITCPMSFHYLLPVHQQSFFKNLVTPFDCMLALDNGEDEFKWTGMYSTDFGDILSHSYKMGGIKRLEMEKEECVDKTVAMFGKAGVLIKRDAADYMMEKRTWKGVEFVSDDVAPSKIEQGLIGIASQYECDRELKQ